MKGFDIVSWREHGSDGKNPHNVAAVDPLVAGAIAHLRNAVGAKKLGAVGYCFGAKYVARFLAAGKGLDVGYVAHPSWVDEAELRAITGPFSISAAETDEVFPEEKRHESERILKELGLPYQINLFSGVSHGFAVRGDPSVRLQKWAKEQAFLQAVAWFDEHLAL